MDKIGCAALDVIFTISMYFLDVAKRDLVLRHAIAIGVVLPRGRVRERLRPGLIVARWPQDDRTGVVEFVDRIEKAGGHGGGTFERYEFCIAAN